jgi:hypothetical protein
VEETYDA